MEEETRIQIDELPKFASKLGDRSDYRNLKASSLVFTGSGDSYAASLFAHFFSNQLARAADPYHLAQAPQSCRDRIVFFTSVSGRTRANIQLAGLTRKIALKRVAITGDAASPLALECDDTILIPYRRDTVTAGTLSFTLSLLAVASLIRPLPRLTSLKGVESRAEKWASGLRVSPDNMFLFVGSGIGFALSAYGSFKIQEVLGVPAEYEHSEQLGHSKLFSLRKTDNIVCLAPHGDKKTAAMSRLLRQAGFRSHLLASQSSDMLRTGLEAAFAFQRLALALARGKNLRDVAFMNNKPRLVLSSRLIY